VQRRGGEGRTKQDTAEAVYFRGKKMGIRRLAPTLTYEKKGKLSRTRKRKETLVQAGTRNDRRGGLGDGLDDGEITLPVAGRGLLARRSIWVV